MHEVMTLRQEQINDKLVALNDARRRDKEQYEANLCIAQGM